MEALAQENNRLVNLDNANKIKIKQNEDSLREKALIIKNYQE